MVSSCVSPLPLKLDDNIFVFNCPQMQESLTLNYQYILINCIFVYINCKSRVLHNYNIDTYGHANVIPCFSVECLYFLSCCFFINQSRSSITMSELLRVSSAFLNPGFKKKLSAAHREQYVFLFA